MKANIIFALFTMIVLLGIGTAGAGAITGVTLNSNVSSTTYFNQPILLTATVSGGSGNYIYTYSVNSKHISSPYTSTSPNSIIFINGNQYGVSGSTTFSVHVSDAANTANTAVANTIVNIGATNSIIVTITNPSSAKIDVGQTLPITGTVSGGATPYSLKLFSGSSSTCASDNNLISSASTIGSSFTFNAQPTNNNINGTTVYYCAEAIDSNSYSSYSSTIPVIVYNAIGGAISGISQGVGYYQNMDAGQSQLFTATPTGGTGSYYYDWNLGNSISVSGSGEFQTFNSPIMNTPGNYLLTLKISDTGTQYGTNPTTPNVTLLGSYINVYPFSALRQN